MQGLAYPFPWVFISEDGLTALAPDGYGVLADDPIARLLAVPELDAVLVVGTYGRYLILDKRTNIGAACKLPQLIEPTTSRLCSTPIEPPSGRRFTGGGEAFFAGHLDGAWMLASRAVYWLEDGTPDAKLIADFGPEGSNALFAPMPWEQGAFFGVSAGAGPTTEYRYYFVNSAGLKEEVEVSAEVGSVRRLSILAIAPNRRAIVLRSADGSRILHYQNRKLSYLEIPDISYWMPKAAALDGGNEIFLASGAQPQGDRFHRRPAWTKLWRLDQNHALSEIELKGPSGANQATETPISISDLFDWPSRNAIILNTSIGLHLYRNGHISHVPNSKWQHNGGVKFVDLGTSQPGLLISGSRLWWLTTEGDVSLFFDGAGHEVKSVTAATKSPSGKSIFLATDKGLLEVGANGMSRALIRAGHPAVGPVRSVIHIPDSEFVVASTPAGLRAFGHLRVPLRIGGEAIARHPNTSGTLAGRRFFVTGLGMTGPAEVRHSKAQAGACK